LFLFIVPTGCRIKLYQSACRKDGLEFIFQLFLPASRVRLQAAQPVDQRFFARPCDPDLALGAAIFAEREMANPLADSVLIVCRWRLDQGGVSISGLAYAFCRCVLPCQVAIRTKRRGRIEENF